MEITNEQLDRFLKGECSAEEEAYIIQHPELLESYLKEEWRTADAGYPLPDGLSEMMYQEIRKETTGIRRVNWPAWIAAAAAVLLLFTVTLFKKNDSNPAMVASLQLVTKDTVTVYEKRNTNNEKEVITLPDGSVVHLFKNSSIRFDQPFSRNIYLKGHASFEITKDEEHPFMVYAGATKTTVLGTSFNIAEDADGVTVKLYTGKVVVNTEGSAKAVFLSPGQQLKYDAMKNDVAIAEFNKKETVRTSDRNNMSFNATPISEVLQVLSAKYKVPIVYDKQELDQIYFTGAVLPSDPLMTILQVMGSMNGLTISQQHDTIIIRKMNH